MISFKEGRIFYEDDLWWRIDHLIDVPATIQCLLYFGQRIVGRWLFKPYTSLKEIKNFMCLRAVESRKNREFDKKLDEALTHARYRRDCKEA